MTRNRKVYHVRYDPAEEVWVVRDESDAEPGATYPTKREAVSIARGWAHGNAPSQLIIYRQDGQVEEELTYGDDPSMYPS